MTTPQGRILYGLHFCPGVAEYQPDDDEPFRVFLNSDALRAMDPSFAGKPVFLLHVDDDSVPSKIDDARKEADGWVIKSFYNKADGKHWAQFILLTQRAIDAVEKRGYTLSNAYRRTHSTPRNGTWNGVDYDLEIHNGEYRHLALVPNPRYESMVLTPEEFAKYNDEKLAELDIANDDGKKGESGMKLNIFKRQKVEKIDNAGDLSALEIELPKSKKSVTIETLVNMVDHEAGKPVMANMAHHLQMGEKTMSVGDFLAMHNTMAEEHEAYKNKLAEMDNGDDDEEKDEEEEETENDDSDDDGDDKKEADNALEERRRKKKEADDEEADRKRRAKEKARELRNARDAALDDEAPVIETTASMLERGRAQYGSGR